MDERRGAADLAEQLRSVVALVESGDLPAEVDQLGYLRGAVATAEILARQPSQLLDDAAQSIEYSTSVGRMLAGIFGALAEYEVELTSERASDARASTAARGKQTGRPKALTDDQARLRLVFTGRLLYRGAPPAVRAGLSWTDKLDQARWFARRNGLFGFESDVWTMLAPSSVLLAQANGRGEGEYVVSALDAEDVIEHVEVVEADPDGRAVPNSW
jgi:hypothetical protein